MKRYHQLKKKYTLKDGKIYWHRLYYDIMPDFLSDNAPPLGHYNYSYYLAHPWVYPIDLYYEAKYFLQRGYRGFSDRDVWNWYSYMAKINHKALKQLAEKKYGHPIGMTMQGWKTRLLKMADGFNSILEEETDFKSYKKLSHNTYMRLLRSRNTRLNNGLKLWSKHFQNLWD